MIFIFEFRNVLSLELPEVCLWQHSHSRRAKSIQINPPLFLYASMKKKDNKIWKPLKALSLSQIYPSFFLYPSMRKINDKIWQPIKALSLLHPYFSSWTDDRSFLLKTTEKLCRMLKTSTEHKRDATWWNFLKNSVGLLKISGRNILFLFCFCRVLMYFWCEQYHDL